LQLSRHGFYSKGVGINRSVQLLARTREEQCMSGLFRLFVAGLLQFFSAAGQVLRRYSLRTHRHFGRRHVLRYAPHYESLENRYLLSTVTVNTDQDVVDVADGVTSLREAIFAANLIPGDDEIVFDFGDTNPAYISLSLGELVITDSLAITGPGFQRLTIDAQRQSRIFRIDDGRAATQIDVAIAEVTLTRGSTTGSGGAILSSENLTIHNTAIVDNSTTGSSSGGPFSAGAGGGIAVVAPTAVVSITNSTIAGNSTPAEGGGVAVFLAQAGAITISDSVLLSNTGSAGGGLHVRQDQDGLTTIVGSTVSGNSTLRGQGGGLLVTQGPNSGLVFSHNTVDGNSTKGTSGEGGGIHATLRGGHSVISHNKVSRNTTSGTSADGGGIYVTVSSGGDARIASNTVWGNSVSGTFPAGIGIYAGVLSGGTADILSNLVIANQESDSGDGAGGIGARVNAGGTLVVRENTLRNNNGGIHAGSVTGELSILRNQVIGNFRSGISLNAYARGSVLVAENRLAWNEIGLSAGVQFGGSVVTMDSSIAYNYSRGVSVSVGKGSSLQITRTTVHGNALHGGSTLRTLDGAGVSISNDDGSVLIEQSTISGNRTAGSGGGLSASNTPHGAFIIRHSTIAMNEADSDRDGQGTGGGVFVGAGGIFLDHTILAGNVDHSGRAQDLAGVVSSNFSLVGAGAEFLGPLADNGGLTQTHALLPGSPALNAGDPTRQPGDADLPEYDQRKAPFVRVAGRIDIGAVEQQIVVDSLIDEVDGDFSAGHLSLREAIEFSNTNDGAEVITFHEILDGGLINLLAGALAVTDELTIDAKTLRRGLTLDAHHASRLFQIARQAKEVHLKGLKLRHGTSAVADMSSSTAFWGGAIASASRGALTIEDMVIEDSLTVANGSPGGAISAQGRVNVIRSRLCDNRTEGRNSDGGAIHSAGEVILLDSVLCRNRTMGDFASGGAVFATRSVSATRSTLHANSTSGFGSGGGAIAGRRELSLTQSTISGNVTTGDGARGGAVYSSNLGVLSVSQSTISGNRTLGMRSHGGGIAVIGYSYTYVSDSTLTENRVDHPDGEGGAIYISHGSISISSSIISGNNAGRRGPDLLLGRPPQAIDNSLIGDPTDSGIDSGTGVGNLLGVSALLGPLAFHGGPTQTHALLPGSPAFDQGNSSLPTDQRGLPHPIDLPQVPNGEPGTCSDIGSYEAQSLPSADFSGSEWVDGADLLAWQRGFGTLLGATGNDGNSDDDGDVDGSDLAAWTITFGQSTAQLGHRSPLGKASGE
jgi:hypothetical protein